MVLLFGYLLVSVLLVAAGGGMLVAVDTVIDNRRTTRQPALARRLRTIGWLLAILGFVIDLVVAACMRELPLDTAGEYLAVVGLVVLFGLVSLSGALMIKTAKLLGVERTAQQEDLLNRRLDGLALAGRFWLVFGLVPVGLLLFRVTGILVVAVLFALYMRRRSRQDSLLWVLAIAAQKQMPLAPAVQAFSEQCSGGYRRRVLSLAAMLADGVSLPDALDRLPGLLPRAATLAAGVGWHTGTLNRSLRELAVTRTVQQPFWRNLAAKLAYVMTILIVIQAIAGFILYFIAPKFRKIFLDFGVELPHSTKFVMDFGEQLMIKLSLPIVVSAELVCACYLVLTLFGWTGGWLFFIDRIALRRHTGVILRALALAMEGGATLLDAVLLVARSYPSSWMADRLAIVHEKIKHGMDWLECLRSAGLIRRVDAALLASAQRVGNLPWALREVAYGTERRLGYHLQVVLQILFPLVVLSVGGMILLLVVAYFSPLVKLISELSA